MEILLGSSWMVTVIGVALAVLGIGTAVGSTHHSGDVIRLIVLALACFALAITLGISFYCLLWWLQLPEPGRVPLAGIVFAVLGIIWWKLCRRFLLF